MDSDVVGGAGYVEQIGESSQFNGLSNGTQCCLDAVSLHLVSLAVVLSFPHPLSENLQDHKSLCFCQFLKVWDDIA